MRTLYAACVSRLGMSLPEAATYHNVRLDTVKSWSSGRNQPPAGVWAELRAYEAEIIDRSEAIREGWEDAGEIRDIEVAVNGDPRALMAAADFLLGSDEDPPIRITLIDPP